MTKILICCPRLNLPGGVANLYKMLAPHFPVEEVSIFQLSASAHPGRLQNKLYGIADVFRMIWRARHHDIILVNSSLGRKAILRDGVLIAVAKYIFRLKTVVFWHGWNFDKSKEVFTSRITNFIFRRVLQKVDLIFCLSPQIKKTLQSQGAQMPIFTVFTTCGELPAYLPRPFGNKSFTILFLARIEQEKGIRELIAIFEQLVRRNSAKWKLIIAGTGHMDQELKQMIAVRKLQENISLVGYVTGTRKNEIFAKADCYILPSYSEGMPCALLEAMAWGLPILVTPVGGIPAFFIDKVMGYMLPRENIDKWVSALIELSDSPEKCAKISSYNHQYAAENFTAAQVAKKIVTTAKQGDCE